MSSPQFNVIVNGTVLEGFDSGAVLLQLQQQLKLPAAKAQQLLAGKTVTVKRNVDEAVATAYCKRLLAMGVSARAVAGALLSETVAPATVAPTVAALALKPTASTAPASDYFAGVALASRDIANASSYNRAVHRATAGAIGVASRYTAIALLGIAVFLFYAIHFAYLLAAPPLLFSIAVYLLPLLALWVLSVLLIRPFLPIAAAIQNGAAVSPLQQPALFAFVAQLCRALALKPPEQMAFTTETRNSLTPIAGFKNLLQGEYRLTLSLPLLESSRLDEFAGVLAADLATQAKLPALRYRLLTDTIAIHLDTCIASRDLLAQRIDHLAQSAPAKLRPLLRLGNTLCEQANRFLQRFRARLERIEWQLRCAALPEQDRYCARIAGAPKFAGILLLQHKLDSAGRDANAKNNEDRIDGGRVDDLSALIRHYADSLDEKFERELRRQWDSETTPRRDEAPIVRERIEQVSGAASAGVFKSDEAAQTLLLRRDELARDATLNAYRRAGLTIDAARLIATDELTFAATQDILQRQQAIIYFNNWFKPFRFWSLADYQLIRDMPLQDAAMQLSVCVNEIRRLTPDRARLFVDHERLQNQLNEILIAQHVLAAGKKFSFRYVSYDGTTLVPMLEDRQRQLNAIMEKLAQQEAVMGGRITLGLRLSGQAERDVEALHDALRLLHDTGARLYKLSLDIFQLEQLLQRQHELREADYSLPIKKLETKIADTCALVIVRLNDIPYPLDTRYRSLKSFVETVLEQPAPKHKSPTLQRAQRMLDVLYRVNEKLSLQAADYGTIAEEAYRIEPIKLVGTE